jgi:hypothetical protein
MRFYVMDPSLDGGGFMDTLSNTWQKVKDFVTSSPLAQKVVKEGLERGKRVARGVADDLVDSNLDKLPGFAQGPARAFATKALDKLENMAEQRAEEAIMGRTPTSNPAVPNEPISTSGKSHKRRRMRGSGIDLGTGEPVSAVPFDESILPEGATVVSITNSVAQMAY